MLSFLCLHIVQIQSSEKERGREKKRGRKRNRKETRGDQDSEREGRERG